MCLTAAEPTAVPVLRLQCLPGFSTVRPRPPWLSRLHSVEGVVVGSPHERSGASCAISSGVDDLHKLWIDLKFFCTECFDFLVSATLPNFEKLKNKSALSIEGNTHTHTHTHAHTEVKRADGVWFLGSVLKATMGDWNVF